MQVNVHDNNMHYIAVLNNDLPKALHFINDTWHRYLYQPNATFDLTIMKMVNGIISPKASLITDQCYLSFKNERSIDQVFNIMQAVEDDTTITLSCCSTTLKLLTGQANIVKNTVAHSIQWYLEQLGITTYAGVTLGTNELSSKLLVLSFDSQDKYGVQLLSLMNSFGAEFEFLTPLNTNGTLKAIILNIYQAGDGISTQGVGQIRDDVMLTYGKNVSGVTRTSDKDTLVNSSTVTDSNGKVNWNSLSFSKTNANGDVEFYKKAGDTTAYAPISAQMYPAQSVNGGTPYTRTDFSIDAKTASDLTDYVLSQFIQYAYPSLSYDVTALSSLFCSGLALGIGDTIKVKDDNFAGGLLLQARVSELVISSTNHTNDSLVLSNYVKLQSQISDASLAQMKALIDAATPYVANISTTNGVTFKNGTGSTDLTAHIYKGSSAIETIADSYEWFKDGTSIATTQTITVNASDITDKAVYYYQATVGGNVVGTAEVTIANVDDGPSGADGRSVVSASQKFQLTTTATVPTQIWDDSSWLETMPVTTATNKYLWTLNRTTYNIAPETEDVVVLSAVNGDSGTDGQNGKIVSDEEPTNKFKSLTWTYSGTANLTASDETIILPNTDYWWNGTHWILNLISVNNLAANSITADKLGLNNVSTDLDQYGQGTASGTLLMDTDGMNLHTQKVFNNNGHTNINTNIYDNYGVDSKGQIYYAAFSDPERSTLIAQVIAGLLTNGNQGSGYDIGLRISGSKGTTDLTSTGLVLSTDIEWTTLSTQNTSGTPSVQYCVKTGWVSIAIKSTVVTSLTAGQWKTIAQLPAGNIAIPTVDRTQSAAVNLPTGNYMFKVTPTGAIQVLSATTPSSDPSFNGTLVYPIG